MSRLPIRRRLLLAVIVTVGAALAAMIVGFNLLLAHNLSSDADRLARTRAVAELGVVSIRHGNVVVVETPDDVAPDSFVWVFSRSRLVESPAASSPITAAARRLAAVAPGFADVANASTRLYATPVVVNGRRYGSVVGGISLKPYDQTRETALLASLGLGALVLLLVAIAGRWLLLKSLTPVARMTRLAGEWSDRDLDRRFDLTEPRDELTNLATTLDGLLDRLAASLRREQRFSAELSHELRTPLSRVIAEADLALRRERTPQQYRDALALVRRNAQQLARTIDALVAAARHQAGSTRGTSDALAVANAAVEAGAGLAAEREVAVRIMAPDHPVRLHVDGELATRVLQPVVENACRYGNTAVNVTISRKHSEIVYRIADDGPGVDLQEQEQIFEPGWRGKTGRRNGDGAGLGLALARRLARSVAGDITASSEGTGGQFVVTFPAAR
jgi:signal transduction histidine kinase